MRAFGNLMDICLELLAADRTVLFEFRIASNGEATGQRRVDSADGIELPVVDLRAMADKRVVLRHNGNAEDAYRHRLRLRWAATTAYDKRPGVAYQSQHTAKITGSRQTGTFHVGAECPSDGGRRACRLFAPSAPPWIVCVSGTAGGAAA